MPMAFFYITQLSLRMTIHTTTTRCGCTWCLESVERSSLQYKTSDIKKKCKSMTLSRKKLKTQPSPIILLGSQLDQVDSIKYLGLAIQCDLTWSKHIENICSKARRLVGLLFLQFYHYTEPSTIKTLYLTLIRPNLEYASVVWDPTSSRIVNY